MIGDTLAAVVLVSIVLAFLLLLWEISEDRG